MTPPIPSMARSRRTHVAVTGAAGFIGSRLSAILGARGHAVTAVVRPGAAPVTASDVIEADLEDGEALASALSAVGVDVVCHCAWVWHPRSAGTRYHEQARESVVPALQVAIAAGVANVDHVVFVSSGGGLNRAPVPAPPTAYGWAKRSVEALLAATSHDFGFDLTVLRPTAVYGEGQDPSKGLGVVVTFLTAILTGAPLHIYGSPRSGRDFLHVDDLAECIGTVVEQRVTGVYEVGGTEVVTLEQLVCMLEAAVHRRADLRLDHATGFDPELVHLDNRPLTAASGWTPRRRLPDAIPGLAADVAERLGIDYTAPELVIHPVDAVL